MKSLKIGQVDLDTSHPGSWLPVIREMGHEVVGVFDGGTVYPEGYAAEFARENEIPKAYDSLEEMAADVDVAIIHSCNWDIHIERARPFIEMGKSLLIDKPMAGNLKDVNQFLTWGAEGNRVTGGSSLRFCYEARDFCGMPEDERGRPTFAMAGCAVDEFNYGIHAYSLISGVMGTGIQKVRYLGSLIQHQYELVWEDGKRGILTVGKNPGYLPFYATIVTTKGIHHIEVDSKRLYRALLESTLPYLAGEADAPMSFKDLIEPEITAIAARISRARGGEPVYLSDVPLDDPGYDGAAFGESYRISKLGQK